MIIRGQISPFIIIFVCFSLSFYFPEYLFFLPFIVLTFLFLSIEKIQTNNVFFWGWFVGALFFFIQMFGFLWVTIFNGNGFVRFMYPLVLMIYCGAHTGIWFYILKKISKYNALWKKYTGWFLSSLLYFVWVDRFILWPFGQIEGYSLVFPLIPLVGFFQTLHSVAWSNKWFVFSLVIIFQINIYHLLQKKKWIQLCTVSTVFPFIFLMIPLFKDDTTEWIDTMAFLPLPKKKAPYEMAQDICLSLIEAQQRKRGATIFILPESAFPFVLSEHQYALQMWHDNVLQNDKKLIIGSHSRIDGKLYNSFLLVHQCRITESYNKSHLVPFFEYIPPFFRSFLSFKDLFITSKEPFLRGKFSDRSLTLNNTIIVPCLCSELFFNSWKQVPPDSPFVCLMNDFYFKGSGYSKIMLNYARFFTFVQKRSLAYIDSSSAYCITQKGYRRCFK